MAVAPLLRGMPPGEGKTKVCGSNTLVLMSLSLFPRVVKLTCCSPSELNATYFGRLKTLCIHSFWAWPQDMDAES